MPSFRSLVGLPEDRAITFQDVWGRDLTTGLTTQAGVTVTDDQALKASAVFGAIRILTDGVSTLPSDSFIRRDGVRRPYRPVPQWLHNPNPLRDTNRIDFLTQVMVSLLTAGNAYVLTARDGGGMIQSLTVLNPAAVEPRITDGTLAYWVEGRPYTRLDVLHVKGILKPAALTGLSPLAYARETIGLALAAQDYGASFFGNGALPGAVIEVPNPLSSVGVAQMRRAWNDLHKGSGNASKVGVLTEGASLKTISIPPEDAQFLQTRAFQVPDIARFYGVPPHLLGDATNSTSWGSGLEQQTTNYVTHSLRPWVERIEAGLSWLLTSEGFPDVFIKLNVDGLQRGTYGDRIATYNVGLQAGVYNLDEVRAWEDLAPLPNGQGQTHRVPLNLGDAGAPPAPATRSKPEEGTA